MALRRKVYKTVTQKDMVWFDTKIGVGDSIQSMDGSEQGPGLHASEVMSKFPRPVLYIYL